MSSQADLTGATKSLDIHCNSTDPALNDENLLCRSPSPPDFGERSFLVELDEHIQEQWESTSLYHSRDPLFVGVTVNIQPTKYVHGVRWRDFNHDEQRAYLSAIESRCRREYPYLVLHEIHYEECPKLNQIHFHALYSMPQGYMKYIEEFYEAMIANKSAQLKKWRYLDMKVIKGTCDNWLTYIRKGGNR